MGYTGEPAPLPQLPWASLGEAIEAGGVKRRWGEEEVGQPSWSCDPTHTHAWKSVPMTGSVKEASE